MSFFIIKHSFQIFAPFRVPQKTQTWTYAFTCTQTYAWILCKPQTYSSLCSSFLLSSLCFCVFEEMLIKALNVLQSLLPVCILIHMRCSNLPGLQMLLFSGFLSQSFCVFIVLSDIMILWAISTIHDVFIRTADLAYISGIKLRLRNLSFILLSKLIHWCIW